MNPKDQESRKSIDLTGKTAGIIGYGNIGKKVAKALKALGMKVLIHDLENSTASLEEIFKQSKVISIHIPAIKNNKDNTSNINLIDKKLLQLCNETILINLATDIIVDTEDLVDAIKSKKIIKKHRRMEITSCKYADGVKYIK